MKLCNCLCCGEPTKPTYDSYNYGMSLFLCPKHERLTNVAGFGGYYFYMCWMPYPIDYGGHYHHHGWYGGCGNCGNCGNCNCNCHGGNCSSGDVKGGGGRRPPDCHNIIKLLTHPLIRRTHSASPCCCASYHHYWSRCGYVCCIVFMLVLTFACRYFPHHSVWNESGGQAHPRFAHTREGRTVDRVRPR